MMVSPVVFGFLVSLGMGLGAFAVFLWAVMDGQMEETEEVKYRILAREQEDDPAAERRIAAEGSSPAGNSRDICRISQGGTAE